MAGGISTLGLRNASILQMQNASAQLGDLSTQLSTGKKSLNLADYSLSESERILDFSSTIAKNDSYVTTMATVKPRLDVYQNAFSSLENVANQALGLVNTTEDPNVASADAIGTQIDSFSSQVQYLLNQKVGDRYIFAGARYTTAPVGDITALPAPTTTTLVTSPTLPDYDTGAPGSSAAAYTKASTNIDDNYSLTYGVTSNDTGMQGLVLGLRWAKQAAADPANYAADMTKARGLITQALTDLRTEHGTVVANLDRIGDTTKLLQSSSTTLQSQVDDIQTADPTETAAKITFLQSQLQATYTVTGKIASLSLVNFL